MPFSEDERADNEKTLAAFCQDECDRQQKLFLTQGRYEQVWPEKFFTPTLRISVDVYQGMKGKGFVIHAFEHRDDAVWERCVHVGPEGGRDLEWRKYEVKGVK